MTLTTLNARPAASATASSPPPAQGDSKVGATGFGAVLTEANTALAAVVVSVAAAVVTGAAPHETTPTEGKKNDEKKIATPDASALAIPAATPVVFASATVPGSIVPGSIVPGSIVPIDAVPTTIAGAAPTGGAPLAPATGVPSITSSGATPAAVMSPATVATPVTVAAVGNPVVVRAAQTPALGKPPVAAPVADPAAAAAAAAAPVTASAAAAPAAEVLATAASTLAATPASAAASTAKSAARTTEGAAAPAAASSSSAPQPLPAAPVLHVSTTAPTTAPTVAVAPMPAGTPLAAQLARPVFTLAAAGPGAHTMTISVTPDNVGPVTVQAHISAEGIRVELFAPTDAGRDAIRAILPDLRKDLAGGGVAADLDLSSQNQPGGRGDAAPREKTFAGPSAMLPELLAEPAVAPAHISLTLSIDVLA